MARSRIYGFDEGLRFIENLPRRVHRWGRYLRDRNAEWIFNQLHVHIANQDLGWAPNSPSTLAKKRGDLVMVETWAYYRAIRPRFPRTSSFAHDVTIGPGDGLTKRTKEPLQKIAWWLEHGTTRQPARPLYSIVLAEWRNEAPRLVARAFRVF